MSPLEVAALQYHDAGVALYEAEKLVEYYEEKTMEADKNLSHRRRTFEETTSTLLKTARGE